MNIFGCRYSFNNFEYPYKFKLKLKNGAKFKFLNNYYAYFFIPTEKEQSLYCYSLIDEESEAEKEIKLSNSVLEYLCCIPIYEKNFYVFESQVDKNEICTTCNMSRKNKEILNFISNKVSKFKVERKLFDEVINLYSIALSNCIDNRAEDALLYYFKIIEKIAKKYYTKFHEKYYTKKVKQHNKQVLKKFIDDYFKSNLKVIMTENMLSTATDEIYKALRNEAYNSIFLKISFLCENKNINIDINKLNKLVKLRNKLAHGDFVEEDEIDKSIGIAIKLSNEFIASYFFNKSYNEISIDTDTYDID